MDDLISRQAAIDALGNEPEVWSENDQYDQYELGLNNQWNSDVDALKALPSAQQWIPVSERLPNEDEVLYDGIKMHGTREMSDRVLAIDKTGFIKTGYFINTSHTHSDGKKWEFGDHYDNEPENWIVTSTYHEPIAWMPLPDPYRKEEEIG